MAEDTFLFMSLGVKRSNLKYDERYYYMLGLRLPQPFGLRNDNAGEFQP